MATVISHLKQSLSITLHHFYPLAGKLSLPPSPEEPHIVYTRGDSVSVTIGETNGSIGYFCGDHAKCVANIYSLLPQLPSPSMSRDDTHVGGFVPIMGVQIMVLGDGSGYSIGVSVQHAACDERTFDQFMKCWALLSKSLLKKDCFLGFKSTPRFDRNMILDNDFLKTMFLKQWWNRCLPDDYSHEEKDDHNMVKSTFVLSLSDINMIKNHILEKCKMMNVDPPLHLSPYVSACSYIWNCLLKVQETTHNLKGGPPLYLGFNAGGITRLGYDIPSNYFGNCIAFGRCKVLESELVGEDGVVYAAKSIGKEIKRLDKDVLGGGDRWICDWDELNIRVLGSPKVDSYGMDFGWGKVEKVEKMSSDKHGRVNVISLSGCKNLKGGIEIGVVLSVEQMSAFTSVFNNDGIPWLRSFSKWFRFYCFFLPIFMDPSSRYRVIVITVSSLLVILDVMEWFLRKYLDTLKPQIPQNPLIKMHKHSVQVLRSIPKYTKPQNSIHLFFRDFSQSTAIPKKQQRVRDHGYDNYMEIEKKMRKVLKVQELILSQPNSIVSSARLDNLSRRLGFKQFEAGRFVLKFPHIFDVFEHPVQRILYCRLTRKALLQIQQENEAVIAQIDDAVTRLRKLLMLSNTGCLGLEHVRIARREFGFPEDFEYSVILKHPQYFRLFEDKESKRYDMRSLEAQKRMEKRAIRMIHEMLSLTVEKKINLERIAHFRITMNLPKKLKEFLLQHQGIFYISTRGNYGKLHTIFLREAYNKGELIEPNELYLARRKLAKLITLRRPNMEQESVYHTRENGNSLFDNNDADSVPGKCWNQDDVSSHGSGSDGSDNDVESDAESCDTDEENDCDGSQEIAANKLLD
ncbi:HXXXD-type acyl-transferase family protein [Artemisia annua]|uniref:HXXXD-type acyl-transferase family protein n=1 Tax=Artemisia annua TaxID=35608 RepID=A0A2U1N6J3_ARTAN|nr:HXXXD-type acyl-transferase family protein [Artemisia annua]